MDNPVLIIEIPKLETETAIECYDFFAIISQRL